MASDVFNQYAVTNGVQKQGLAEMFLEAEKQVERKRSANLFEQLNHRSLTQEEEDIIKQRVENQRKLLEEYEKRERARKVREVCGMAPGLPESAALRALELCGGREDDAILRITEDTSFKRRCIVDAGGAAWVEAAVPRPAPRAQGTTTTSSRGPSAPKPRLISPSKLEGGIFYGRFRSKMGPYQSSNLGGAAVAGGTTAASSPAPQPKGSAALLVRLSSRKRRRPDGEKGRGATSPAPAAPAAAASAAAAGPAAAHQDSVVESPGSSSLGRRQPRSVCSSDVTEGEGAGEQQQQQQQGGRLHREPSPPAGQEDHQAGSQQAAMASDCEDAGVQGATGGAACEQISSSLPEAEASGTEAAGCLTEPEAQSSRPGGAGVSAGVGRAALRARAVSSLARQMARLDIVLQLERLSEVAAAHPSAPEQLLRFLRRDLGHGELADRLETAWEVQQAALMADAQEEAAAPPPAAAAAPRPRPKAGQKASRRHVAAAGAELCYDHGEEQVQGGSCSEAARPWPRRQQQKPPGADPGPELALLPLLHDGGESAAGSAREAAATVITLNGCLPGPTAQRQWQLQEVAGVAAATTGGGGDLGAPWGQVPRAKRSSRRRLAGGGSRAAVGAAAAEGGTPKHERHAGEEGTAAAGVAGGAVVQAAGPAAVSEGAVAAVAAGPRATAAAAEASESVATTAVRPQEPAEKQEQEEIVADVRQPAHQQEQEQQQEQQQQQHQQQQQQQEEMTAPPTAGDPAAAPGGDQSLRRSARRTTSAAAAAAAGGSSGDDTDCGGGGVLLLTSRGAGGGAGGGARAVNPLTGHTCRGRVRQKSHKNTELVELGALVARKGWYNAGYIFPAGFKSRLLFR